MKPSTTPSHPRHCICVLRWVARLSRTVSVSARLAVALSLSGVITGLASPLQVQADPRPRPEAPTAAPAASVSAREITVLRLDWTDSARQRRVPVLIYLPSSPPAPGAASPTPAPVIVFSHGLGGSREGYSYLGRHWAEAGYVSVHLQHLGSDDAVWKETKATDRMQAVKRAAASPANALARPVDVSFVIDELTRQNQDPKSVLHARLDLGHIGAAGHSFGGFTVMAIAGQSFLRGGSPLADPRVKAVIQMSAPVIGGQRVPQENFDGIRIPVFHMTGTKDDSPVGETTAADRRIPYDRMQHSPTCLVVFQGGDHMIFSGRMQKDPGREVEDEAFQRLICRSTTAFWDAHLRNQPEPKKWLYNGGFATLLGASGTFEHKSPTD